MATANELLVDQAIEHQVSLAKYSNGVVRRLIALLNRTDERLALELEKAIDKAGAEAFSVQRLESLLASTRNLLAQSYGQVGAELRDELKDFTAYEASWQEMALRAPLPLQISVASVSVDQVYAAAMSRPFQGVLLKGALEDIEALTARKIRQAIAQGIVEGRTTDQIIRDIRGTKALKFKDGLLERSRRDVEAIVRTAISHTAGVTQDAVMGANPDLISALMWSSHLDLRTSPICRVRDGKLYRPVDHKPIGHNFPWLAGPSRAHWRCRAAQIPVLKSWKELGINIDGSANLKGTRASLDGQVPKGTTYADWLKKQPAAKQDEVLGPARGALLRTGNLPLESMYSQKGEYLSLEELRKRYPISMESAGQFRQPRGEFTVYDAGYPIGTPDVSTPARAAAVKLENEIRADRLETGAIIDQFGAVLVRKQGQPDRVSFSYDEQAGASGNLLTHNHPRNGTFSLADVRGAIDLQLGELRAVGPTLRYRMSPEKSWPTAAEVDAEFSAAEIAATRTVGRMIASGDLEPKFASAELGHQIWDHLSRRFGLGYRRERS